MMKYMIFPLAFLAAGVFLTYIGEPTNGLFAAAAFLSIIALVCIYNDRRGGGI